MEFDKFIILIQKNSTISYNYHLNLEKNNSNNYECNENRLGDDLNNKYSSSLYEGIENKRKINRIFFNPGNCRYNFIEICDKSKNVVWIVPLNATYSEKIKEENENEFNNIPTFLGNFANLNKNHISMLEQLNKLFNNEIYECFLNIGSISPPQFSLHVHVFKKKYIQYNNSIAILQQGTRIEKFLNTKTVINLLILGINTNNYEYFNDKNYNINFLIHDKA